jgi:hypothetical protein
LSTPTVAAAARQRSSDHDLAAIVLSDDGFTAHASAMYTGLLFETETTSCYQGKEEPSLVAGSFITLHTNDANMIDRTR